MALDRWIAFIILLICLAYGYAAFFTMDGSLPPIMRRSPVWPSSFPKVLAIGGIVLSLAIVVGIEKSPPKKEEEDKGKGRKKETERERKKNREEERRRERKKEER